MTRRMDIIAGALLGVAAVALVFLALLVLLPNKATPSQPRATVVVIPTPTPTPMPTPTTTAAPSGDQPSALPSASPS